MFCVNCWNLTEMVLWFVAATRPVMDYVLGWSLFVIAAYLTCRTCLHIFSVTTLSHRFFIEFLRFWKHNLPLCLDHYSSKLGCFLLLSLSVDESIGPEGIPLFAWVPATEVSISRCKWVFLCFGWVPYARNPWKANECSPAVPIRDKKNEVEG